MFEALIDGDILTYRIGFASENDTESIAIARCSEFLEELLLDNNFTEYQGWLTGSTNYRTEIAVTAPYKGNRKAPKPKHYQLLRDYMRDGWAFTITEGIEADDAIGIAASDYQYGEFCICSIDKDLDMIAGNHYNFVKRIHYEVSEDQAIRNFYKQMLTGDRVDNIVGIKGIGPVKAEKVIKECKNENEMYLAILEAYEGNKERVLENGRLLWIQREPNQMWQPPV